MRMTWTRLEVVLEACTLWGIGFAGLGLFAGPD